MDPAQRFVLITGGSRGIGAAVARGAARAGWNVAVNYLRDAAAAERVAAEVRAVGRRAFIVQADVAQEDQVQAMFARVDREGGLAALVNSAGIVDRAQRVDEMDGERLRRMFAVNALGTIYCAREAVRRLGKRHGGPGGVIVNLSSAASRLGSPGQYVDYAATKGAVDTFTLGLAREVAADGVRVAAVRPGVIDTDIHASGGQPDRVREVADTLPMQRAGSADEVAAAVLWLLSDGASYATGALIDVAGGR